MNFKVQDDRTSIMAHAHVAFVELRRLLSIDIALAYKTSTKGDGVACRRDKAKGVASPPEIAPTKEERRRGLLWLLHSGRAGQSHG